jgi:hypothetical protein
MSSGHYLANQSRNLSPFPSPSPSYFVGLGFELKSFTLAKQALYCLSHTSSPFFSGYFGGGISRTICLGWLGS